MDRYETAQKALDHFHGLDVYLKYQDKSKGTPHFVEFLVHKLNPNLETIREALEKAKMFDQMVEARKLTDRGEWVYRPDPYDDWGYIRIAEANEDGYRPVVAQAKTVAGFNAYIHRERRTDPYENNARFITLCANLTEKGAGEK